MSADVTGAVRAQDSSSREILTVIEDIDIITGEVIHGSALMLQDGENITAEMRNLDRLTQVITDSMNEMASGVLQIDQAVHDVSGITQKNRDNIGNLLSEIHKFKV